MTHGGRGDPHANGKTYGTKKIVEKTIYSKGRTNC